MSKRLEAQQIISDIRYQLWPYPTTWGACECGYSTARGGRRCHRCLVEDLEKLVGDMQAVCALSGKMVSFLNAERRILDAAERQSTLDELTQQAQDLGLYDDA